MTWNMTMEMFEDRDWGFSRPRCCEVAFIDWAELPAIEKE